MARVNIEDRAFADPRLRRLCRILNWGEREALGCLAFLWHDSQELLKLEGTFEDLADWTRARDDEDAEKIIRALWRCGYISVPGADFPGSQPLAGYVFAIHGNVKHVEAHINRQKTSSAGGKARAGTAERNTSGTFQKTQPTHQPECPADTPAAGWKPSSAIQCNAIQYNSKEEEEEQKFENCGAVPELEGICDELLKTVKYRAQHAWIKTYGLQLVKTELPFANERWLSNEDRNQFGKLPLFLSHWFANALRDGPKIEKNALRGSPNKIGDIPLSEIEMNRRAAEERAKIIPADPRKVHEMIKTITGGV